MSFSKRVKSFFLLPKKKLNWWLSNWRESKEFRKQLIAIVLGFGIAGLVWGGALYKDIAHSKDAFIYPIHWLGILSLAIFGGLCLGYAFFKDNKKKIFLLILLGFPVWILAFLIPVIFTEWLMVLSAVISVVYIGFYYLFKIDITPLLNLKPSLVIAGIWLEFFFTFLFVAIFYSFFFKKPSKLKLILIPPVWVGIFAIISPIIGNLIGSYLFHSLLLAYLLTFLLISLSFALSLFKEIKYDKS